MLNIKIQFFYQRFCFITIYASKFKQSACDISWGEVALISQFQFGLQGDVQDLLLILPKPFNIKSTLLALLGNFLELGPQRVINRIRPFISFSLFNINFRHDLTPHPCHFFSCSCLDMFT